VAVPKDTIWPIEPHTSAKHQILRKYLDAWLPIVGTYNKRIIYIDGFAGPGEYAGESRARPSSPFSGADQFQFAVLLAAGALIAFLGSLGVFTRRIGHS
jgi:hypothetical protein